MKHLTRNDYASALQLLRQVEAQADDAGSFARAVMQALNGYLASELTTLSVCDLRTGQRRVVGLLPEMRLGAMAMPLFRNDRMLVSVVLNRRGHGFSERDRERLELLRPHLAFLYRHACQAAVPPAAGAVRLPSAAQAPGLGAPSLTRRETEVMHWLAGGKTDAEIAALLAISPRTVQKHLEHVYVKLGVETRTAAVMRAFATAGRLTLPEPV